jgi:hypothetical protein
VANNTLFDGDAYWNDSWVQELDGDEERLYHFYITSPNLDKSGVYKQSERSVEFYVRGLGVEKIREITEKFTKAKKVIRCGEWIIVPSSLKHQNYRNNQNVVASIIEYLKKIPDEVFEELRKCDYPLNLNTIIPPKKAKTDDLPLKTDDLSMTHTTEPDDLPLKTDDLSMTHTTEPDDLPLKTDEFNLIQSNSTELNSIESEFNINSIQDNNAAKKLSSHFIQLWQHNGEVFNFLARIQNPKDWEAFWKSCTFTEEDLDVRVGNFVAGVKSGAIERRFIPASPDAFVLRGGLQRSVDPYKKQDKKISNDLVDDTSQYFREV